MSTRRVSVIPVAASQEMMKDVKWGCMSKQRVHIKEYDARCDKEYGGFFADDLVWFSAGEEGSGNQ